MMVVRIEDGQLKNATRLVAQRHGFGGKMHGHLASCDYILQAALLVNHGKPTVCQMMSLLLMVSVAWIAIFPVAGKLSLAAG